MAKPPEVLAIVPARGGSKGIPLKNLSVIGDKSLLSLTLELALSIEQISAICVSTDHDEIKAASLKYSAVTVVDRPAELSGDRVADAPVLQHSLEVMEDLTGVRFDLVLMLQVTSPLRTVDDIQNCLDAINSNPSDTVWTVSPTDLHYHPLKQLVVDQSGNLTPFDESGINIVARQQLVQTYHRNGACYALRRDFLTNSQSLYSPSASLAVISDGPRVNVDTEEDLRLAEKLISERDG